MKAVQKQARNDNLGERQTIVKYVDNSLAILRELGKRSFFERACGLPPERFSGEDFNIKALQTVKGPFGDMPFMPEEQDITREATIFYKSAVVFSGMYCEVAKSNPSFILRAYNPGEWESRFDELYQNAIKNHKMSLGRF